MFRAAAALGDEPAAGLERAIEIGEEAVVVGIQWKVAVLKMAFGDLVEVEAGEIGLRSSTDRRSARRDCALASRSCWPIVETDHMTLGQPREQRAR